MIDSTIAAAICLYWLPEAVTKASAPTVTGCLSADASTSAKMKLFQAKMNASSPAAAMPGAVRGIEMRRNVVSHPCPAAPKRRARTCP